MECLDRKTSLPRSWHGRYVLANFSTVVGQCRCRSLFLVPLRASNNTPGHVVYTTMSDMCEYVRRVPWVHQSRSICEQVRRRELNL